MTRALSVVCTLLLVTSIGTNAQTQPSEPLVVDTPSKVTQCGVTNLTWSGGLREHSERSFPTLRSLPGSTQAPYTVLLNSLDATMPAGANLAAGTFNTSILWTVIQPAGQGLFLIVADFRVSTANSKRFVVQSSNDTSCLPSSK